MVQLVSCWYSCFQSIWEKIEHQDKLKGYDPVNKLYHIVYAADDTEEYYHNEV